MKRTYQLLAAAIVAILVPLAASVPASAASTCDVGFTGPDSQNLCTSVETFECTVRNENIITINNTNTQTGVSGQALSNGNTTSGGATSGTVTNTNGTTFAVTIVNNTEEGSEEPAICTAAVIVPATVTPETVTPVTPATPKALPVTSGDPTLAIIAAITGVVGIAALVSVIVVALRRRLQ